MNRTAHTLFTLNLEHSFYADGVCKGLRLQPTAGALQQMSALNAHVHTWHGGLTVLMPAGNVAQPAAATSLCFQMEPTDTNFVTFTQLPAVAADATYYVSNADGEAVLTLQTLPVQDGQFTADFSEQIPTGDDGSRSLQVLRLNGQLISQRAWNTRPGDPRCPVDLGMQRDGGYRLLLTASGQALRYDFFKFSGRMQGRPWGFLEWYAVPVTGAAAPQDLRLRFAAMLTRWQYYLVQKHGLVLRNPVITTTAATTGEPPVTFEQSSQPVRLPNGNLALEFTASGPLPLQEAPSMEIMLEDTGLARSVRLPYAAPGLLYPPASPPYPNSRIYVYL